MSEHVARPYVALLEQAPSQAPPKTYCIHYHLGEVYFALGREAESHFRSQLRLIGTREARLARQSLDRLAVRQ